MRGLRQGADAVPCQGPGHPRGRRRRTAIDGRAARRPPPLVDLDVPVRDDAAIPLDHAAPRYRPPLGPHDPGDVRAARLAAVDEDGLQIAPLAVPAEAP